MDLEMTGLDPETDVIVEIATLVTDDELNIVAEGPELVIFQPDDVLARMNDFVTKMHTTSGLLELIKVSTVSEAEAMQQTLDFIKCIVQSRERSHCVATAFVPTAVSLQSTCPRLIIGCTTDASTFQQ
jgi:oligoribonuclease